MRPTKEEIPIVGETGENKTESYAAPDGEPDAIGELSRKRDLLHPHDVETCGGEEPRNEESHDTYAVGDEHICHPRAELAEWVYGLYVGIGYEIV